jgi:hypothetical protein
MDVRAGAPLKDMLDHTPMWVATPHPPTSARIAGAAGAAMA